MVRWFTLGRDKKKGDKALRDLIDNGLKYTSVTVVLIGAETSKRKWVNYEIEESYRRGKGLLGIYIHNVKNILRQTDYKGENPFNNHYIEEEQKGYYFLGDRNRKKYFSELYPTYDWLDDNGRRNIGSWIEAAAKQAGR